jgi:hypothetical protein
MGIGNQGWGMEKGKLGIEKMSGNEERGLGREKMFGNGERGIGNKDGEEWKRGNWE